MPRDPPLRRTLCEETTARWPLCSSRQVARCSVKRESWLTWQIHPSQAMSGYSQTMTLVGVGFIIARPHSHLGHSALYHTQVQVHARVCNVYAALLYVCCNCDCAGDKLCVPPCHCVQWCACVLCVCVCVCVCTEWEVDPTALNIMEKIGESPPHTHTHTHTPQCSNCVHVYTN